MKALDEYFLMVVFTLLLNTAQAHFMFKFNKEMWQCTKEPAHCVYFIFQTVSSPQSMKTQN